MSTLRFDGREYDLDLISPDGQQLIRDIQAADLEIQRLNTQLKLFQTAREAHIAALRRLLTDYGVIPTHLKQ